MQKRSARNFTTLGGSILALGSMPSSSNCCCSGFIQRLRVFRLIPALSASCCFVIAFIIFFFFVTQISQIPQIFLMLMICCFSLLTTNLTNFTNNRALKNSSDSIDSWS